MILPHPESDLSLNLMVVGADILSYLNNKERKNSYVLVETVLSDFLKKGSNRTPELFIYTLTFLFTVGIIEKKDYRIKLKSKNYYQPSIF